MFVFPRSLIFIVVLLTGFTEYVQSQDTTIVINTFRKYKELEYRVTENTIDSLKSYNIPQNKLLNLRKILNKPILRTDFDDTLCLILGKGIFKRYESLILETSYCSGVKWPYLERYILFSDDSMRYEYCQEVYGRFNCQHDVYHKTDSTLFFVDRHGNKELWEYIQVNDTLYEVWKKYSTGREVGYAKSILPFIKTGDFKIYNRDRMVLIINYSPDGPVYFAANSLISDTVYTPDVVDVLPLLPDSTRCIDEYIRDNMNYFYYSSDIMGKIFIEVVINKMGRVVNAQILRGLNDPVRQFEAIKSALLLPDFRPAIKDGQAVNMRYVVGINTLPVLQD